MNWDDYKLADLKDEAKSRGIEGYSTMKKAELIEQLENYHRKVQGRTEQQQPITRLSDQSTVEMITSMRDSIQNLGSQLYALEKRITEGI